MISRETLQDILDDLNWAQSMLDISSDDPCGYLLDNSIAIIEKELEL